jgi:transmembrane sensor
MKRKNDRNESTAKISKQAAYWCFRLKGGPMSMGEGLQFLAWLTRSRQHVHEFLLVHRLDAQVTRLMRTKHDQSNVTHVNWWQGPPHNPPQTQGRRRSAIWRAAATILVAVSAIYFVDRMNEEAADRTVTTAVSESKTQKLEDGSQVSIKADSSVRVEFTDLRRDVFLSHGRAMFDVVMDMKRPFVVSTFLVDIATVESKFSVTIDTSVEVMVSEGMVAISGRGTKAGAPVVTVKKGETYRVPVDGFRPMVAGGGKAEGATRVAG